MARFGIIILFLGTAIAIFLTQTQPSYNELNVLKSDKQAIEEALQQSRELQTLRDELLEKYNAVSADDVNRLNKLLPANVDNGELIVIFENIAKNRGFLLKKIDVKEQNAGQNQQSVIGAPPPAFRTIGLSMQISGSYNDFLSFLADLEKSLRIIDIEKINFNIGAGGAIDFQLNAKTYAANSKSAAAVSGGKEAQNILTMLARMRSVEIDTDFFKNEVFQSLTEFAPVLETPKEYGRLNPFSPIK